jgi:hypothetical protein
MTAGFLRRCLVGLLGLLVVGDHSFVVTTTAFCPPSAVIRTHNNQASTLLSPPRVLISLPSSFVLLAKKENDKDDLDLDDDTTDEEAQKFQTELDAFLRPPPESNTFGSFNSDNFDESKIPIPLFTAVIFFLGSTYVTFYMLYYGIVGFNPEDGPPPLF